MYNLLVFSTFTGLCNHHNLILEYFYPPKRNSMPIMIRPPAPHPATHTQFLSQSQPLILYLSLWIHLLWTFHVGIMQYLVFCYWLLYILSIMFSRFILVFPFYSQIIFHFMDIPLLFIHYQWLAMGFHFCQLWIMLLLNIHIQVFVWMYFSVLYVYV